jgi:large subunit ribosomal protein L2
MLKRYKPTTKSLRNTTRIYYKKVLSGDAPMKSLLSGATKRGGRNGFGRITVRHKGGGHKRLHRDVDFTYAKRGVPATVETVEYDPFRSGFIARICYRDGERRYALLPQSAKVGDVILAAEDAKVATGNRLPLGAMPVGTFVYNLEIQPGTGAKMVRSAGTFAEVIAQDSGMTHVRLPSTEVRKFVSTAWATVGEVSNPDHHLVKLGKAGRSRWKGIRPTVRGTAMNPVDHPHGGGEGRQGRGLRRAKTLWGKPSGKGQKTRTPKKHSNVFIVSRRKVGKKQ